MQELRILNSVLSPKFKAKMSAYISLAIAISIIEVLGFWLFSKVSIDFPVLDGTISIKAISSLTFSIQKQNALILVVLLFIFKSLFSSFLNYSVYKSISKEQSSIASQILEFKLSNHKDLDKNRTREQLIDGLTMGLNYSLVDFMSSWMVIVIEGVFVVSISVYLFFLDPSLFSFFSLTLGVTGIFLIKVLGKKARNIGSRIEAANTSLRVNLTDTFLLAAELNMLGKVSKRVEEMKRQFIELSHQYGLKTVVQNLPKYIYELVGVLTLGIFYFSTVLIGSDAVSLVNFGVFLVAGTRMFPSVLRFQSALLVTKSSSTQGGNSFGLLDEMRKANFVVNRTNEVQNIEHVYKEIIRVDIDNLVINYSDSNFVMDIPKLEFKQGEFIGVFGDTGCGKTTFGKALTDSITLAKGRISLNKVPIGNWIRLFPGTVGSLSQTIHLSNGDLYQNISLDTFPTPSDEKQIDQFLNSVDSEVVSFLRNSVAHHKKAPVLSYSGGQRQRLGLLRAMYTDPTLLIIDEGTSSQDSSSEVEMLRYLSKSSSSRITVFIAHRKEVLNYCTRVIYLEKGKIAFDDTPSNFEKYLQRLPG